MPDGPVTQPPGVSIDQIIAPLTSNMANAGDFSFEAIKALGSAVPMFVTNSGESLLELWLEPLGRTTGCCPARLSR